MRIASGIDGSSTMTDWKRRSSARSFSIVLPEFVGRRCAQDSESAATECGLQNIASVQRTFGGSCANNRVHFVDEENNFTVAFGCPLMMSSKRCSNSPRYFGACNKGSHIQLQDAFADQRLWYLGHRRYACQTFGDGSLSDAGFTDKDRIVLGFAIENGLRARSRFRGR